ncbi:MAG: carbohydrate-binding protein [Fibrobacter sp.]|nr:carbohydrate-binding protein [Fibrobacter sp.]
MSKKLVFTTFTILFTYICSFGEFDPCQFNFGMKWKGGSPPSEVDYLAEWLGSEEHFNMGGLLETCRNHNKTPVFYSYIIAFLARRDNGLGDCDVSGGNNLCTKGAEYIKQNKSRIKNKYSELISAIKNDWGTNKTIIFFMEPDYYQYTYPEQSSSLSFQEAGQLMEELVDIIKNALPNALVSMDISPWIEDQGNTSSWYGAMPMDKFDFLNTSGGIAEAASSSIKGGNQMTYSGVSNLTGKPIFADCGYGAGGGGTGHNSAWDDANNIKARIKDGVIGILQDSPNSNWGNTISNLRSQLANEAIKSCGLIGEKYKLTINAGSGGTVKKEPDSESYPSDTKVTLTAEPSEGYVFKNWSGDASGTNKTVEITMDMDKSVTAVFEQIPSNMFSVTVNVEGGSGSVKKSPDESYYQTGSQVTLTATPVKGVSVFEGWSGGGLSGNDLSTTLTIGNSNVVITAMFLDTLTNDSIKVEAEDFTQKNGDQLQTETENGVTSIGWIEDGYSTTYEAEVQTAGKYSMVFRVASGIANSNFDVQIDGKSVGSISFAGTNDNNRWSEWQEENLGKEIELDKGTHTVQLNFKSAINVDWFLLVLEEVSNNVIPKRKANNVKTLKIGAKKGGFVALLPSLHNFSSWSLFDITGKMVKKGIVKKGVSELSFSDLTKNIWILKLEGINETATVRAAVIR